MGGIEVVRCVCGVFVVSVDVDGFVLAVAIGGVGVFAVAFSRHFDLNLSLRSSLSAVSFCWCDWIGVGELADGVVFVVVVEVGGIGHGVVFEVDVGVLTGDGVGGMAGSAHSVVFGVVAGVLAGDGVGGIAGSAHSVALEVDVGVLAGDGVGGIAGSAHSVVFEVVVGVSTSDGVDGIAEADRCVTPSVEVGVLAGGGVAGVGGGVLSWPSRASIASAKNLSSPPLFAASLLGLRWLRPPKRMSVLWFGMKSALESTSSRLLSPLSLSLSLKRVAAVIARP